MKVFQFHEWDELIVHKSQGLLEVVAEDVMQGYDTMNETLAHKYELVLALVKIYDNYITPLGREVKCWKSKYFHDGTITGDTFVLGMTITIRSFEETHGIVEELIIYYLPMQYWHIARVIELDRAPANLGKYSNDILRRIRDL